MASATEKQRTGLLPDLEQVKHLLAQSETVDIESMPKSFTLSGNFGFPIVGNKSDGTVLDIAEANKDKFVYAWVSEEDLKQSNFAGYRKVLYDCPAAFTPDGTRIPDHEWSGSFGRAIAKGSTFLCFCLKEWNDNRSQGFDDVAKMRIKSYFPGASVKGQSMSENNGLGGVNTVDFETGQFETKKSKG